MVNTPNPTAALEGALTSAEVAALLQVHPNTVGRWRREGTGPAYVRRGRQYLYPRPTLDAWIVAHSTDPEVGQ